MALLETLIGPITALLDKIIPDKEARAKAQLELLKLEGTQEMRMIEARLVEVNRRLGGTMLVTSHHIGSTLRMAHQIVFLCGGGAVQGPTREIEQSTDPRIAGFFASGEGGDGPGDRSRSRLPSPGQDESV